MIEVFKVDAKFRAEDFPLMEFSWFSRLFEFNLHKISKAKNENPLIQLGQVSCFDV